MAGLGKSRFNAESYIKNTALSIYKLHCPRIPFTYFGMIHFSAASRCSAISHVISSPCAFLPSYAVASTYQLLPHDRICLVAVCRPVVSFLQCASQIGRVILEFASFPCLPPALRKSYETDSSRIPTPCLTPETDPSN